MMLWSAGAAALCLLVCLPLFLHYKHALRYRLAACYKCLGTLCAAALVLIAAIKLDPRCWVFFAGIMFHVVADWVLEFNFFLGVGLFAAGHVFYIAYFTNLCPPAALHLICVVCLLAVIAFMFWRWRNQIGKRMPMFVVYAVFLSVMAGCAIACLSAHTLRGQLIAAGGVLFFISDAIICARTLFRADRTVDWAIMITYYCAQLLFGFSCLLQ